MTDFARVKKKDLCKVVGGSAEKLTDCSDRVPTVEALRRWGGA